MSCDTPNHLRKNEFAGRPDIPYCRQSTDQVGIIVIVRTFPFIIQRTTMAGALAVIWRWPLRPGACRSSKRGCLRPLRTLKPSPGEPDSRLLLATCRSSGRLFDEGSVLLRCSSIWCPPCWPLVPALCSRLASKFGDDMGHRGCSPLPRHGPPLLIDQTVAGLDPLDRIGIRPVISLAANCTRWQMRTSVATTAKPRPCRRPGRLDGGVEARIWSGTQYHVTPICRRSSAGLVNGTHRMNH